MRYINRLTADPLQISFLTGNPGQRITLKTRFLPRQRLWSMDVTLDDFVLNGIILLNSPNILHGYANNIPFGILCTTLDGQDPYTLDAFATGYAKLFLLSADEVILIEGSQFS